MTYEDVKRQLTNWLADESIKPVGWGVEWCPDCGNFMRLLYSISGTRKHNGKWQRVAAECRRCSKCEISYVQWDEAEA